MFSLFCPFKNKSSITAAKQVTVPPAFFIKSSAADAVPPVARRSSINKNFLFFASIFNSRVSLPYSKSYSIEIVFPGNFSYHSKT